jgi:acyl carrier protein
MSNNELIKNEIFTEIGRLIKDKSLVVDDSTELIGGDSLFDSMNLVELCLALEDKASSLGFEFDWTSEAAMSKSRGMFRTAGALVEEFINQRESRQ